jgi:hypothetical protein
VGTRNSPASAKLAGATSNAIVYSKRDDFFYADEFNMIMFVVMCRHPYMLRAYCFFLVWATNRLLYEGFNYVM